MKIYLVVAAALTAALGLRTLFLIRYKNVANLDEANIGVMGLDILRGNIPVFMYGHHYFGPLEAFFEAAGILFFGPDPAVMRMAMVILSLFAIVALWRGARLLLDETGALAAVVWYSIPPVILTVWTILPNGAHIAGMLTGAVLFYLAARLIINETPTKKYFFITGLMIGFSLWNHPGNLLHVVAALFMVFVARPRIMLGWLLPISIVGAIIGGFPFWLHTVKSKLLTFQFGQKQGMGRSSAELLADTWATLKMAQMFLGFDLTAKPLGMALVILLGLLLVFSIGLTLYGLVKRDRAAYASFFGWILIVESVVAYVLIDGNKHGWAQYRYFLPTIFSLALILGYVYQTIYAKRKAVALTLVGVLIVANFAITTHSYQSRSYNAYIMDTRLDDRFFLHHELLPVFNKLGITHSFVRFYDDAPIVYLTGGKVTASAYADSRLWEYSLKTLAAESPSFVIEKQLSGFFNKALLNIGAKFKVEGLKNYDLYHDIRLEAGSFIPLDRTQMSATAYPDIVNANLALDGDFDTFWNSQKSQTGDEWILIDLGGEREIARVDILPTSVTDMPADITIKTSVDGEQWLEASDAPSLGPLFWSGPHPVFQGWEGFNQYIFKPHRVRYVKILQKGQTRWHWHVREIYLYGVDNGGEYPNVDWGKTMETLRSKGVDKILGDFYFSSNVILKSNDAIWANARKNNLNPDDRSITEFDRGDVGAIAAHKRDETEISGFLQGQGLKFIKENLGAYTLYFNISDGPVNLVTLDDKVCHKVEGSIVECDMGGDEKLGRFHIGKITGIDRSFKLSRILHSKNGEWVEALNLNKVFGRYKWTGSHLVGMASIGQYQISPINTGVIKLEFSKP